MRIAIFSDTFPPQVNGVARTLNRLVRHLEKRNIPCQVFVPECYEEEQWFASNIHRFASLPFFLYPECRIALPNIIAIHQQLQKFQPSILHLATPFNMGLSGLYYGKKHQIAMVSSYHTHFDRYLEYYNLKFASRWIWQFLRWFHDSTLATFVPSAETKEELKKRGFSNVQLWSRGVDCQLFHPGKRTPKLREKYGIRSPYLFLYVGRIAPEKDLDILLEVMAILPEAAREQIHWIFVGDGPYLPRMKSSVSGQVTFTGYLSGEELAEAYASADLFVFPSSTETFGNVVLESLASGTPVLGVRAGGVQEIVQHGQTGLLCNPRDAQSLAEAILEILAHPEQLPEMGKAARRYALSQSWEMIFDRLLVQYEAAIRRHAYRAKTVHHTA